MLDADKITGSLGNAPQTYGGTGITFDWQLIPMKMRTQIILSGGLNVANVGAAIQAVNPWMVDVSSGVEQSKGVKSAVLIGNFMNEVLRV